LAIAPLVVLAACAPASRAPKGWQPMPGASSAWSSGNGSNEQIYVYATRQFGGSLQDLASQLTIDVLMHRPGVKFRGSVPFAPCPGRAGIATFALRDRTTMQEAFAVDNGQAIQITYLRPTGSPVDPKVTAAMQDALCALSP